MKQEHNCCGECIWLAQEITDAYGSGYCVKHVKPQSSKDSVCSADPCGRYVDHADLRHAVAVLIQHNRWRRDQHVPNYCMPVNPVDLGKAIDLVVDYTKTYME